MKKTVWKKGFICVGIPLITAILMTAVSCLCSLVIYKWFWLPEWVGELTELIAYYATEATIFATLGFGGYFILHREWKQGISFTVFALLAAGLTPFLRYITRHICFLGALSAEEMQAYFVEDILSVVYFMVYAIMALIIFWAEKGFYLWILKKNPQRKGSAFSPRDSVGLGACIFFSAMLVSSVIYFLTSGEFALSNFLSLFIEVAVNGAGYFMVTATAWHLGKADSAS